jgi:hypothetical protein
MILAAVHNYIDVKAVALYATTHRLLVLLSVSIEDINQYYGTIFSGHYPTASLMSWSIYTPSTHPFEVAGLCGSAEEFKTH